MRKPALTKRSDGLALGSDYFTVLGIMYDELVQTIKHFENLSLTQYRIMLRLFTATSDLPLGNTDLSNNLNIKPNALTQALDYLERCGFIERSSNRTDARARLVTLTKRGCGTVETIDQGLRDSIFPVFEDNLPFKAYSITQEAVILVGQNAERNNSRTPLVSPSVGVTSPYISALDTVEMSTQVALKRATGASYNECRIMFLVAETDRLLRAKDICARLLLTPSTVTRAVKKLVDRGWLTSVTDESASQYSCFSATDSGKEIQTVIIDTIDDIAEKHIWSQLDATHRHYVNIAGEAVLDAKYSLASDCFTSEVKAKLLKEESEGGNGNGNGSGSGNGNTATTA